MKPLVLDLFSGTGSATQPFVECGKHRVVRIDIAGKPDIRADVRHLPLGPNLRPEFVWASPPCEEFSDAFRAVNGPMGAGKKPDTSLWWLAQCWALRAPLWCIENVRGAQRWMGKADFHRGSRYLWTNIPILSPMDVAGDKYRLPPSKDRPALRARIPRPLAEAVHRAVCEEVRGT